MKPDKPRFKKGDLVYYQDWEGRGHLSQVRAIKTVESQISGFEKPSITVYYHLDTLLTTASEKTDSATVGSRWEKEAILVKNAPPHLLVPWVFTRETGSL